MPRIQEYLPEVDATGPVGAISPNTELLSSAGRGLRDLGNDIGNAIDVVERRKTQNETSDIAANMSQARFDFTQQIQDQTAKGTLDTDQFKQQYDDFINEQASQYNTPGGQNFFNKQAARLKGSLLKQAIRGQSEIAANNAQADFKNSLNSDANTLGIDPSQFTDIYDKSVENVHNLVDQGLIPASQAGKFQREVGEELAKAAVRGRASLNPDDAKKELDSQYYDNFLSPDTKKQLYGEIRQAGVAQEVEQERQLNLLKKAQAAKAEVFGGKALPLLVNGQLTTKAIMQSDMNWEDKYKWLNMQRAQSQLEVKTDPVVKNQLTDRMHLPDNDPQKISDPSQLQDYVGHGISVSDYSQLTSYFDKTPEGQVQMTNRKMLLDLAKSKLTKSTLLGLADPNGQLKLMQFTNELQQKEAELRKQGKPSTSLYDVSSPDFFGKQLDKYTANPQQIIADLANQKRGKAQPAPQVIQTSPGIIPKPSQSPPIEYKPGVIRGNFKFKGGDATKQDNWEKIK